MPGRSSFVLKSPSVRVRRNRWLACIFLWLCLPVPGAPQQPVPRETASQWRINEWAAALERAHRALIEEPGVRKPGEPFHVYLRRLVAPLSGEKPGQYTLRIQGYLKTLDEATRATDPAHRIPDLLDRSSANRANWQRAQSSLSYLPGRMMKVRSAWRHTQNASGPDPNFGEEIAQTLDLVLTALDALRDANP